MPSDTPRAGANRETSHRSRRCIDLGDQPPGRCEGRPIMVRRSRSVAAVVPDESAGLRRLVRCARSALPSPAREHDGAARTRTIACFLEATGDINGIELSAMHSSRGRARGVELPAPRAVRTHVTHEPFAMHRLTRSFQVSAICTLAPVISESGGGASDATRRASRSSAMLAPPRSSRRSPRGAERYERRRSSAISKRCRAAPSHTERAT